MRFDEQRQRGGEVDDGHSLEEVKEDKRRMDERSAALEKDIKLGEAEGAEILKDLLSRLKENPGLVYSDQTLFAALKDMHCDTLRAAQWEQAKKILKKAGISLRKLIKAFHEGDEEDEPLEMPFVESPDGMLAEMVMLNGEPVFAVYDPKTEKVTYFEELTVNEEKVVPPSKDEIFQKGFITLPTEAEEYGDVKSLYNEVQDFVHKYLDVSPDYETIACFYPMLTWVYDVMSVIAYLRAKGDWGVGKSRFMTVFSSICYRSVITTGAMSDAPVFRLMDRWKGTLIMDEGDLGKGKEATAALEKILNCGFERNKPIIKCDPNDPSQIIAFDPFGPKIIATRFEFRDKALESRCFTEILTESHRDEVPIELPPEFYEEAQHLRNKLLMYRFKNRATIKKRSEEGVENFDITGIPKRLQQAARPMSIVLADYPDLLDKLKEFLIKKAQALVIEASETTEGRMIKHLDGSGKTTKGDTIQWGSCMMATEKR